MEPLTNNAWANEGKLPISQQLWQQVKELEAMVLGCMLAHEPSAYSFFSRIGSFNFFVIPENRMIYGALCKALRKIPLSEANKYHNLYMDTFQELMEHPSVPAALREYAIALPTYLGGTTNFEHYAVILRQLWAQLWTIERIGTKLARMCDAPEDPFDFMEDICTTLENIERHVLVPEHSRSLTDLVELWQSGKTQPQVSIRTGFERMDNITGPLESGQLIIIAGKTGFGKTTYALNLARWIVQQRDQAVMFFSLEMSGQELMQRLLSQETRIPMRQLNELDFGIIEAASIEEAKRAMAKWSSLQIDDTEGLTPGIVSMKVRAMMRQHRIRAVVIDYLHLMEIEDEKANDQERLSKITRELKSTARKLGIPIILLSQLNKSATDDPDLESLRGSGMIANNADKVLFVCPPDQNAPAIFYDPDVQTTDMLRLKVAKNRQGTTGDVYFRWSKHTNRLDFT